MTFLSFPFCNFKLEKKLFQVYILSIQKVSLEKVQKHEKIMEAGKSD